MIFDHDLDQIIPDGTSTTITIGGNGGLIIPSGTTLDRPSSPGGLVLRYNTDTSSLEGFNANTTTWNKLVVSDTNGAAPITSGGTGLTTLGTANQLLGMNAAATAYEYKTLVQGSGVTISHSGPNITISATGGGGSGTVTSVTVNGTAQQIISTGSPITTSGTITLSLANNPIIPGTEGMVPPSGTTAQQPVTPTTGQLRYNMSIGDYEGFLQNTWLPFGEVLQVVTADILQQSVTAQIPFDNTTPLNTEGTQICTANITPYLSTSKLIIMLGFMTDSSASNRNNIVTLFDGSAFIGVSAINIATTGRPQQLSLTKVITSGSTATKTISARCGSGSAATTTYINRATGATFGGTNTTQMIIIEVK